MSSLFFYGLNFIKYTGQFDESLRSFGDEASRLVAGDVPGHQQFAQLVARTRWRRGDQLGGGQAGHTRPLTHTFPEFYLSGWL